MGCSLALVVFSFPSVGPVTYIRDEEVSVAVSDGLSDRLQQELEIIMLRSFSLE